MGGLVELLKGIVVGTGSTVDIGGTVINAVDLQITGAGPSDRERAIPTVSAKIYQKFFSKPDENLPFWGGYVPRLVGQITGAASVAGAAYAAYAALGAATITIAGAAIPALALVAAPTALMGAYALARGAMRYCHDFINGEEITEGGRETHQKASVWQGISYGWNQTVNPIMGLFHSLESSLTGRGYDNSHITSTITESSSAMRRNFRSIAGSVAGAFLGQAAMLSGLLPGLIVSNVPELAANPEAVEAAYGAQVVLHGAFSLGMPLVYTLRDAVRTITHEPAKLREAQYVE